MKLFYTSTILLSFLFLGCNKNTDSDLVKEGAQFDTVGTEFQFTEGPASNSKGNVYFSDIPQKKIYKYTVDNTLEIFQEKIRETNGLLFDKEDNFYILDTKTGRCLIKHNIQTGEEVVLTDNYKGKKYNSPNDLWIDPNGGIYFTDPRYGNRDNMELEYEGVFYLPKGDSSAMLVEKGLVRPNGVLGTLDGKTLYIADHKDGKVWKYDINSDATLANKQLFAKVKCDGMCLDEKGNVYITEKNVLIYSPEGELIQTIKVDVPPTNVTFGGANHSKLFITARKSVYSIEMNVKGAR